MTVIAVSESIVNEDAAVPPKLTAAASVKFVPVIVTEVPPLVVPMAGLIDVTVGGVAVGTGSKKASADSKGGRLLTFVSDGEATRAPARSASEIKATGLVRLMLDASIARDEISVGQSTTLAGNAWPANIHRDSNRSRWSISMLREPFSRRV